MPLGCWATPKHSAQFRDSLRSIQGLDVGFGASVAHFLDHLIVCGSRCGHRGQMRDAQHLMLGGDGCHLLPDRMGGFAADIGVDLIEDQNGNRILVGQHSLQGQHDAGKFAAGGDGSQGAGRFAGIGGKLELHPVHAGLGG